MNKVGKKKKTPVRWLQKCRICCRINIDVTVSEKIQLELGKKCQFSILALKKPSLFRVNTTLELWCSSAETLGNHDFREVLVQVDTPNGVF